MIAPKLAARANPAELVRVAGLDRIAAIIGMRDGETLAASVGVDPRVALATGLYDGAADRAQMPVAGAARTVVKAVARCCCDDGDLGDITTSGGVPIAQTGVAAAFGAASDKAGASLAASQTGAGTPGSVPVVESAWDFSTGEYILQSGDTLTGLSITYLGSGVFANIKRIWSFQSAAYKANHTMDKINAGDRLKMPPEAITNAKALINTNGEAEVAQNGTLVSTATGDAVSFFDKLSLPAKIGLAVVGAAAIVGGAAAFAKRGKGAHRARRRR